MDKLSFECNLLFKGSHCRTYDKENLLKVEWMVLLLNFQIGDSRIESYVKKVDGEFLRDLDPIAY